MKHLNKEDRIWIAFWHRLGKSGREIGELIGRCHTDISRELLRNSDRFGYSAKRAQLYSERRSRTRFRLKLDQDPRLKEWVADRLLEDWSPEEISGRTRKHPSKILKGKTISTETIYQFVYSNEGQILGLWRHLRRRQSQRRPLRTRHTRPTLIKERTSIHLRPEEVGRRITPFHWESDTVEGRRSSKPALSVQEERLSRLTRIHLVADTTAIETLIALKKTVNSVPKGAVKTMTFDNGHEGAKHNKLKDQYGIGTFFCDPYCSHQKASVENTNGLISQ